MSAAPAIGKPADRLRPGWIHPGFRLIEGGHDLGWPELAAMPLPAGGAVVARRPSQVLAALAAAEVADRGLLLTRGGEAETAGWDPGRGFSVTLESSGTTGAPKRLRHDFDRLCGRLRGVEDSEARWLLTYEPATFAGLQVMLTAAAAGATLVAVPQDRTGAGAGGAIAGLVHAARVHAVTHISGTPSFWRAFLIALDGAELPLAAVTLGGEAVDQPLLDRLAERFPTARLRHIYASTEAGALFSVGDGRAGFPAAWLSEEGGGGPEGRADEDRPGLALRIAGGVLEVRSPRAALGTAGGADGWLSTGDLVERCGDRVLFAGRLGGLVNVGGVKVSPEAVERRLLAVEGVADAVVAAVPSPITGHLLTATIVPVPGADEPSLRAALRAATADLVPAARPRALTMAATIPLSAAGKKSRKGSA
ncbi:AMP-binding protein [Azospirillum picis]|uniref:Long-chain-fatty-acid--CoA ligase n=1 Tax=Azospirillum picis TaxID=488438 RepID=A0ABU0MH34_9PROT|nr:class I adenylate-forming enzyme family protein [Azospirillum picis]MBP2299090.1 acyl-coenzyme A synthetase/AMP-(fatty) acid ligase [Azospirillum picis]MDQ0532668.1 acyl-coenzyme A synthetase/AMP-(fatty) acid ligase [Azospirillum picis]